MWDPEIKGNTFLWNAGNFPPYNCGKAKRIQTTGGLSVDLRSCKDPSKSRDHNVEQGRIRLCPSYLPATRPHIPQGAGDLRTCVAMLQAELTLSYKGFQNIPSVSQMSFYIDLFHSFIHQ
jgi:hypothetical protein